MADPALMNMLSSIGDQYSLSSGEEFSDPGRGSYTKLPANPEADARWQRAALMDQMINEREKQRQLEDKRLRMLNNFVGAESSGDRSGMMSAKVGLDDVSRIIQGQDEVSQRGQQARMESQDKKADRNQNFLTKLLELSSKDFERTQPSADAQIRAFGDVLGGPSSGNYTIDNTKMKTDRENTAQELMKKNDKLSYKDASYQAIIMHPEENYKLDPSAIKKLYDSSMQTSQPQVNEMLIEALKGMINQSR